ncbi:reverse transcriptase family protein [Nonomuraea polychroma]
MEVQRWILRNILGRVPAGPFSFAYEHNKSITMCARRHLGCKWLIKVDLHDFFSSIDEVAVYAIFHGLGYQALPSLELARICTRQGVGASHKRHFPSASRVDRYQRIPAYLSRALGFLPQGSPTSGALANLVMKSLDEHIAALSHPFGFVYTRYADDLVFSSADRFDRKIAIGLIHRVTDLLRTHEFIVHRAKTRVVPPGAKKIVLGLQVDGDRVRLPPDARRRITENIRGVERFGLTDHVAHRHYSSVVGFVERMRGLLAFSYDVDKEWTAPVWIRWGEALERAGYWERTAW